MSHLMSKLRKGKSGQAMVEFVIVLPVFLLIFFFCMDISWYFAQKHSFNQLVEDMVTYVPGPSQATDILDWNRFSPPPWLYTSEELEPWNKGQGNQEHYKFFGYKVWLPFDFTTSGVIGQHSKTSKEDYENKFRKSKGFLDWDGVDYTLTGGWLAQPAVYDIASHDPRTPSYYNIYCYADVILSVSYRYKPFTFVGDMLFCKDGEDTCEFSQSTRSLKYIYTTRELVKIEDFGIDGS